MLGKIFGVICSVSFVFALFCGKMSELSSAVLDGAAEAVTLTFSLVGSMALWCGLMRVFERAGVIKVFSKLISPFLRVCFPAAYKSGKGAGEICACVAANMLGIGNAATPFALSAMKKMQEGNPAPDIPTDDMVTLAVLNCSPASLLPTTLITLRRAAGSSAPYGVVLPVWICSFSCAVFAVVLSRTLCALRHAGRRGK